MSFPGPAVISLQSEEHFAFCSAYMLTNSLKCPLISVSFLKDISSATRILIDFFSLLDVIPLCLGSIRSLYCACVQLLSCVQLFVTPQTVAHQALLSMDSPGKNTGVGCQALLQGIFPTRRSNLGLLGLHMGSQMALVGCLPMQETLEMWV